MAGKTVVLENTSKRLWIVGHVDIIPTAAVAVPVEVAELPSVKSAIESGELKIVEEEKEPRIIKTEEEAKQVQREARTAKSGAK